MPKGLLHAPRALELAQEVEGMQHLPCQIPLLRPLPPQVVMVAAAERFSSAAQHVRLKHDAQEARQLICEVGEVAQLKYDEVEALGWAPPRRSSLPLASPESENEAYCCSLRHHRHCSPTRHLRWRVLAAREQLVRIVEG